jgi:hypothetical protein
MARTIEILARALMTTTAIASACYTTSNAGPGSLAMSSNPHRCPEFLRKVQALWEDPEDGKSPFGSAGK